MKLARVLLCSLLAAGCTDFPVIEAGECGNAVKEVGEDCDTFASTNGALCRSAGQLGECRYDCSPQLDGTRSSCPENQGCDSNGVCREASGGFDRVASAEVGAVAALLVGDFDGDGRSDVLSREPADALLQSKFRLHYFDDAARLSETRSFPKTVAPPVFRDINGDIQDDLIFSDLRVGVLLGRRDRRWVPETFSSYRVPGAGVRMVGVRADAVDSPPSLAILTTMNGQPGLYVPNAATSALVLRAPLVRDVQDIAGEVVAGDVIEGEQSPCDEVLFAYRGASELSMYELCELSSPSGTPRWRAEARKHVVSLPSTLAIDAAPIVVDVDGDTHLDVLIGAQGRPYVARGDGAGLEAVATPFVLSGGPGGAVERSMPLAAGDFTADGVPDFVFASEILASTRGAGAGVVKYTVSQQNRAEAWTVARIADLNGNGEPDVVTASSAGVGVQFFSGTGSRYQVASSLPTAAAVRDLVVGDFDGDLIEDIAFLEASPVPGGRDSLKLAFGGVASVPLAPVQVAEVQGAEAVSAYNELGLDSLAVASRMTMAGGEGGAITLLDGSADRLPFAPYALVSLADDGSIAEAQGVAISVGAYRDPTARDVLALGEQTHDAAGPTFHFWLVPSVGHEPQLPRSLEGTLSPRLSPVSTFGTGAKLRVASASADVDNDAIEEALWLMPADGGARCGLSLYNVSADAEQLHTRELVLLEEPCAEPTLASGDLDGDGFSDIAVSVGGSDNQRTLRVLWNDGDGGFASSDSSVIAAEDGSPIRAFSLFDVTHACGPYCSERLPRKGVGARLGYITDGNLYVTQPIAGTRSFGAPALVRSVSLGSALTVGDVDGDGLLDMIVADAGTLTVFRAQLQP